MALPPLIRALRIDWYHPRPPTALGSGRTSKHRLAPSEGSGMEWEEREWEVFTQWHYIYVTLLSESQFQPTSLACWMVTFGDIYAWI